MGIPTLRLFDADIVAPHNLPNQIFRKSDIGRTKVKAVAEVVELFSDAAVETVPAMYDGSQTLDGVVISAVDSMTARQVIWNKVRYNIHVPLYIEARMGAEVLILYTFCPTDPDAVAEYEKTLYSSAEAVHQPCTEKSIIYTVMVAAGMITGQVKKWLVGEQFYFEIVMDLKNVLTMTR
jgi:molybdopterin/thiamine biosynthesis adenylyltransferase